jgi:hypothetical protein
VQFVLLAEHSPETCPTSNAKTRDLMMQTAPNVPKIAEQAGVKILAGPYVNREHLTVVIVETDKAEKLDSFLLESRLPQWNRVRVLPSKPLQEGIEELQSQPTVY